MQARRPDRIATYPTVIWHASSSESQNRDSTSRNIDVQARADATMSVVTTLRVRASPAILLFSVAACSGAQSALDTRGPAAARIAELWWLLLAAATAVYFVVIATLVRLIVRRSHGATTDNPGVDTGDGRRKTLMIGGTAMLTTAILVAAFVVTLRAQAALHDDAASGFTVRVIGHRWWWEIRYVGETAGGEVVTANELHIPTGRRVRLELTSADVIHSLWVPNLQGKTDLVAGRTTLTWLQADRPGISRGQCAEYCGLQHARMGLLVIAEPPEHFERWLTNQRQIGAAPGDSVARRGQTTFLASDCGYCHSVRGERTLGVGGPDLTHVASRREIAAGTLANTREFLTAWIADPQHIKPGNLMPRVPLASSDLRAVVAYLESLR
jgi:cytochrome c oxidase subunit II